MLSIEQCREILEKDLPDMHISESQVEQIREYLYLLAEIELEDLKQDVNKRIAS